MATYFKRLEGYQRAIREAESWAIQKEETKIEK